MYHSISGQVLALGSGLLVNAFGRDVPDCPNVGCILLEDRAVLKQGTHFWILSRESI